VVLVDAHVEARDRIRRPDASVTELHAALPGAHLVLELGQQRWSIRRGKASENAKQARKVIVVGETRRQIERGAHERGESRQRVVPTRAIRGHGSEVPWSPTPHAREKRKGAALHREQVHGELVQVHPDLLQSGEVLDHGRPLLAPVPGALVPAERRVWLYLVPRIDPHGTGL